MASAKTNLPSANTEMCRRAAAHVDAGRAHLGFVVDQRGKPLA
jgi:hypothetical protein